MHKIYNIFIFFAAIMLFASCNRDKEPLLKTVEDIKGEKIAILGGIVERELIAERFPNSICKAFNSTSEILLVLKIEKFDVAVVSDKVAEIIISETDEYAVLDEESYVEDDIKVIVHKSRLSGAGYKEGRSEGVINKSVNRVKENLMSETYWEMILNGLLITSVIFIFSWILAMAIAILTTLLSFVPKMKLIWRPLMLFIKTIHDVPSVVLIFFFYYIVFAKTSTGGIFACIVALGVFSAGSFSNIIHIHLSKIDQMQHKSAHMLGLKGWKKYRYVILPQAVKQMLPFFVSESKVLLRATTFAGYISILDIVKVSEIIRHQTYDTLVPLVFVSIVFLSLSWLISEGLHLSYKKLFTDD